MTQAGMILGTAAYMSPEQAGKTGRQAHRHLGVWAVLYEMLTGRRAFDAEDVSETLAAVLMKEPDWTGLPATIPPTVVAVLRRCLQKDRKARARDIGDVSLALDGAFEVAAPAVIAKVGAGERSTVDGRRPVAAAVLGTALVASLVAWSRWPAPEALAVTRLEHGLPDGQAFRNLAASAVAISPDGRSIVYNAPGGLYIRTLDDLEPRLIPGTEEPLTAPFFSPDGLSVAYFATGVSLKRVAIGGGAPTVISPFAPTVGNSASWGAEGTILFNDLHGIHEVRATGGPRHWSSRRASGSKGTALSACPMAIR